jgi:hypothetical protein
MHVAPQTLPLLQFFVGPVASDAQPMVTSNTTTAASFRTGTSLGLDGHPTAGMDKSEHTAETAR